MYVLAWKPEAILYIYMASCLAVLLFNIVYIFWDNYKGRRLQKRSLGMVEAITGQIADLRKKGELPESAAGRMKRDLKKVEKLRAFEHSMEEVQEQLSAEVCRRYLESLRGIFLELCITYGRRDWIEKAYLASVIRKFGIDRGQQSYDGIMDFLVSMVIGPDVYARENALGALYSIGNVEAVSAAWQKMQDNEISHSTKLLADGLLSFSGDRGELADVLFSHRGQYDTRLVLPVMQFIRFWSGTYKEEFLEFLDRDGEEKELRLEAIRYFRKYPYEPAKKLLVNFLRYQEFIDWEYAAVAALALSAYPGPDTEECLKEGLGASNWYVRLNCAQALIYGLRVPQARLYDVYNGRDRYAREILRYVSEQREIRDQEMKLEEWHV